MIATHKIREITFEKDLIILDIDEQIFKFTLESISEKLLKANDFQRQFYKVSPSGYGIYWPLLDEVLSVEQLIKSAEK